MADAALAPRPGHPAIRLDAAGKPSIEGFRCGACGAVMSEATLACRACASRTPPVPVRIGEGGRLWTWAVVHRSYPGVAVPFVSAVVDMDDGLTLKGTVIGAGADALRQGLPLRLVFDDAGGARDTDGAGYVGFHFVPAGDA